MRRIRASVQARLRRIAFDLQVEPRIQIRIEPRLCGRKHQRRMGGGDELKVHIIYEHGREGTQ